MQTPTDENGFTENTNVVGNYRNFLCNILVYTKRNCELAAKHFTSLGAIDEAFKTHHGSHDAKSWAYSWTWVFGKGESDLPFREVCDTLGLDEYAIRRRIMADCPPNADITKWAKHALRLATRLDSYQRRQASKEIRVPWQRLSDYRKLYPRGEVPLKDYLDGKQDRFVEVRLGMQQSEEDTESQDEESCRQSMFEWAREVDPVWSAGSEGGWEEPDDCQGQSTEEELLRTS